MRKAVLTLMLALATLLTGCATTGELENQAYALVLGVEGTREDGIALTIRIPRIGNTGSNAGESNGGEPYLVLSAEGGNYAQALERLQWATARELNLSHLKLIIASRDLAASEAFPKLIREIAETRHLYNTAGFIVCEGSAKAFIEGQETILGTRLSSEITAMFRHYADHGYIPRATFADLYYATLSGLSDPTGIWGFLDPEEQSPDDREVAALVGGDAGALRRDTQTASSRQYLGAAVFRDGQFVQRLDARDTLCLNLLTARLDSFTYGFGGVDYRLSSIKRPARRVSIDEDRITLSATVYLSCEDATPAPDLKALERDIADALTDMIQRCQQAGIEPFGFAERAAVHFLTLPDWRRFNWRERYAAADVEVRVHLVGSGET